MTCMPDSGGCERHRTDPFVSHLNEFEGSQYEHVACLDRVFRDSPQPEALYVDGRTGDQLVIERKNVVWPTEYAALHRNDHILAQAITEFLGEIAAAYTLTIELDSSPRASRQEIWRLGSAIANQVKSELGQVLKGRRVVARVGEFRWRCALDSEDRLDFDEPETGLVLRWSFPDEHVYPERLPEALANAIRLALESTVAKFRGYPEARGILLVDQFGALRYSSEEWWRKVFESIPVPAAVAEVWLAMYDSITDYEEDWIFERLHPVGESAA